MRTLADYIRLSNTVHVEKDSFLVLRVVDRNRVHRYAANATRRDHVRSKYADHAEATTKLHV